MALLSAVIQRGSRASQPLATAVGAGTLYCVTDEGDIIERSSGSAWEAYSPSASTGGTVTHTGTLTSGQLIKGNGGVDIAVTDLTGDVTTSGGVATTIANSAVTLAKIANAAANSKLVGSGAAGSGSAYSELTLGTNLSMSGTTLNATGGGTGNITGTTAVGSEPGTPSSGDLDFYNNGHAVVRYSGSAWVPWGPIYPLTEPISGDYAWVNQGGASVVTTNGGIFLTSPAGTGPNNRLRVKTNPTVPYVITAAVLFTTSLDVATQNAGLCFRESSSGKICIYGIFQNGSGAGMQSTKFTDATTFSADYRAVTFRQRGMLFLRIADNNTNRICSWSYDGVNFIQFHSVGRTDFLTANQVGFFVNEQTNTDAVGMTLLSWKET